MSTPRRLDLIHLGAPLSGGYDPEVLQWLATEDGRLLIHNMPFELTEDVSFAFVVLPREADDTHIPDPMFSILMNVESYGTIPVLYRNQMAWLVVYHH